MKCFLLAVYLFLLPGFVLAAEEAPISLSHVDINAQNTASIERGAKFFAQTCMACHTMKYLAHNKLAQKAGITLDKMPLKNKEWFLGIVPPDLSLVARVRGADWLYTYLHAFYKDPTSPTGYNNLLVKNTKMTNILLGFQGQQERVTPSHMSFSLTGQKEPPYYAVLKLVKSGSMTPAEFNETMTDLVNFLVYASDPGKVHREHIGIWVILFLLIFLVVVYFLKKEFWKDVK